MPTTQEPERSEGLRSHTLEFTSEERGSLQVHIDRKGIALTRGGNIVQLTKDEATLINTLMSNACSHVWRHRTYPSEGGMAALAQMNPSEGVGEPCTASEARAPR